MEEVSKSQFKEDSFAYFRKVEETGAALVITEHGKPVLKISPYTKTNLDELLKSLRGSVLKYDNPLEPVAEEDWILLD